MSKNSNAIIAFAAGAMAGAVLGILYAPDKGANTRDRLTYNLDKYKIKLLELIEQLQHQGGQTPTAAKVEGEKVINDAKEKAEKLLFDVESLIEQIKNKK